jgi:hypothetical protein
LPLGDPGVVAEEEILDGSHTGPGIALAGALRLGCFVHHRPSIEVSEDQLTLVLPQRAACALELDQDLELFPLLLPHDFGVEPLANPILHGGIEHLRFQRRADRITDRGADNGSRESIVQPPRELPASRKPKRVRITPSDRSPANVRRSI